MVKVNRTSGAKFILPFTLLRLDFIYSCQFFFATKSDYLEDSKTASFSGDLKINLRV